MKYQLADVLATDLLGKRIPTSFAVLPPGRASNTGSDRDSITSLCERVLALSKADTVGISLFNHPVYDELTWSTVVGAASSFQGRRYPLRHSMCGVCFEWNSCQLFLEAQRYFQWLHLAGLRIAEGLVYPLRTPDELFYGTIWILAHDYATKFDKGHVSILEQASIGLYALISDCTSALRGAAVIRENPAKNFVVERRMVITANDRV